ncbi:uncharacterized protein BDW43DRAFT_294846 [Aspergillus alliaceus]|uniref:uncharacterized protein n=1 Tax=Petromyces alliaceus TaxID=209559 RepID=UPI0012A5CDD3|nr:uncharacterized protein BDW43DRAFT_294846 [Aspergillus alliaceus]KAB8227119.1 hypothetical protein BDW43DRAFT_294846 [Aspergillus alliaceus]
MTGDSLGALLVIAYHGLPEWPPIRLSPGLEEVCYQASVVVGGHSSWPECFIATPIILPEAYRSPPQKVYSSAS